MNGNSTRVGHEEAAGRGAIDMLGTMDDMPTGLAAVAAQAQTAAAGLVDGASGAQTGPGGVAEVSGAVATWVEQVGRFLAVLQAALEQSRPREDASPEVRALSNQLPALIRQCRAQVPTPEMIHTWVKTLSKGDAATAPSESAKAEPLA